MGLFDKKTCDICGEKIKLLGNNKLEDANMCNACEKKLSNWFKDRRHTSLEQIKAQLAYREQNQAMLASFQPQAKLGTPTDKFLLIDPAMGRFVVLREGEDMGKNPDLLEISRVVGCSFEVKEDKNEIRYQNSQGQTVSYNPKHYEYKYKFLVTINYNGDYFSKIQFYMSNNAINGGRDGKNYGAGLGANLHKLAHSNGVFNALQTVANSQVDCYPGGFRTDGPTTMSQHDIDMYLKYEQCAQQICDFFNVGAGNFSQVSQQTSQMFGGAAMMNAQMPQQANQMMGGAPMMNAQMPQQANQMMGGAMVMNQQVP